MIRHRLPLLLVLCLLLLWSPLPYGGVELEQRTSIGVALCLSFLLALAVPQASRPDRPLLLPAAAVAAIGVLGLVQASPLPERIVALLSPHHLRLAQKVETASPSFEVETVPLSLAPSVSWSTGLWWLAVAAGLLAAAVAGRHRSGRRLLALSLLAAALFQVLFGARRWLQGTDVIWGTQVLGIPGRLRGTFVNSNHCAFFLGLALPVAFAWGWWAVRKARRGDRDLTAAVVLVVPPVLVWIALFVGLSLTASRAGLVASSCALLVQGMLLGRRRRPWLSLVTVLLLAAVAIATLFAVGLPQGLERLVGTSAYEVATHERFDAYSAALRLWSRFPVFGTGLGTFREGFDLVRPEGVRSTWRHLHNDYLELLATTGLLGLALAGAGLAALVVRLGSLLRGAGRTEDRAAALAGVGLLAAAGVHSLFDFSLAIPANAVSLAVAVAACAAAPRSRRATGLIEVRSKDVRILEPGSLRGPL